jgi:hypothetical protein
MLQPNDSKNRGIQTVQTKAVAAMFKNYKQLSLEVNLADWTQIQLTHMTTSTTSEQWTSWIKRDGKE